MLYVHNRSFSKSQKRALGSLYELYGRYTGLINGCLKRADLEEFGLYWFQTLSTRSSILFDQNKDITSGGLGIDASEDLALQKSFGEAMERHSLSYYDTSKFIWNSLDAVKQSQQLVPMQSLSHLLDGNPDLSEYYAADNESIAWVKIHGLDENTSILYPAGQIYIPCHQTKRLMYTTSSGVAFNTSKEKTIGAGLLEVVERDSIILNHYFVESFEAILSASVKSPLVTTVLQKGLRPLFIRLQSETNIPVVLCLLEEVESVDSGDVLFGIGCSAALSEAEACEKSLKEALFTKNYAQYLMNLRVGNVADIKSLYERFLYYQAPDIYRQFCKRYTIRRVRKIHKTTMLMSEAIKACKEVYSHMYVADITPPYLRNRGYITTKVIIPQAYDLHTREIYFNPSTRHSKKFIAYCKRTDIPLLGEPTNLPHPMP